MKALIPAAGLGTRFLPATKAQPKEMLLVVDRPAIQYVVEEGLASGADEVIIINSREKKAIEDHFTPNPELVALLRERGKDAYADAVEAVGNYNVSYVYQEEALGLGHAVHCAAEACAGEPFYVLLDASVRLEHPHYTLDLRGDNLCGTHYDTFHFVSMGNAFLQRGRPRTFRIALNIHL